MKEKKEKLKERERERQDKKRTILTESSQQPSIQFVTINTEHTQLHLTSNSFAHLKCNTNDEIMI